MYDIKSIFNNLNYNVIDYEKILTLANSVYKVFTQDGIFFIKIYESLNEQDIGFKLFHIYSLLSKHEIPTPQVIIYDNSSTQIKNPYIILREVEGKPIKEVITTLSEIQKLELYSNLGEVVGRIHSITFDMFGESLDMKTVGKSNEANKKGPFHSWIDMHREIINSRLKLFRNSSFEDLIKPIQYYFKNHSHLFEYDVVPRLLHTDLNQKNIFINKNQITGIIDFDDAIVGHSEEEIMRIEGAHFTNNSQLKEAFLRGYTSIVDLDENYEKRRIFYYLSRLLVHIGCIIKYQSNYVKNVKEEEQRIRTEIEDIINERDIFFDKNR
ncbi:MAG: phosphotransferase [Candidatus Nanoarchaeia archaeon]